MSYKRTTVIGLGENRGTPRIYLSGQWMSRGGFNIGMKIDVRFGDDGITITPSPAGTRIVCGKRNGLIPVIDLESKAIEAAIGAADKLQITCQNQCITITPAHVCRLQYQRQLAPTEASLFSGGGMLSLAAKQAGFEPKLAVEINPDYAEIFEHNHPTVEMHNCSVEQVPCQSLAKAGPIGLLTIGIPCEPYSMIRRLDRGGQEKRDKTLPPEAHELGDMVFWALRAVEAINPHTVVIEQVPKFLSSGAGYILQSVLKRLYRNVEARIVNPRDYGSLTGRERAVVIARDCAIHWPEIRPSGRLLGDIFDPEPHEWFDRDSKAWLFNHWDAQTAKGNGFASQVYNAASPCCGTIKKRYFAQQGDNPVIAHPTLPGVFRWLTLNEVKRLHGIPDDYYLGEAKTTAGEVMGQGVIVDLFRQIIEANGFSDAQIAEAA